ncbi:MAG: hypothetical protein CL923_09125 [Deltaproteobacteria bacterium]|jgi:hypothetical protein|nr:hypothetical protein [Deltaproteobacteria bacterium]MDP7629959.1 hypothetical protein [SAR324 cluster bacterium]
MKTRCWLLVAGCLLVAPVLLAQSTVQEEVVTVTVPVVRKNVALAKAKALELADRQALEQVTRRLIGAEAYQLTQALLERDLFGTSGQFVESKRVIHEFRNETLTEYSITLEQHFYRVRLLNALENLGLSPGSAWRRPIPVELRVSPDLQRNEQRTLLRKLTERLNAFRVVVTRVKSTESATPTTEPIHQLQFVRKTAPDSSDESASPSAVFSLTLLNPEGGVLLKQQLSAGHQVLPDAAERLLDELVLAWPRFHQKLSAAVRSNAQLTLKFNGRSNPVYERIITQHLSAVGVDVRKLNLYTLSADTTTFELTTDVPLTKLYDGIRKTLKAGHTTPASTEASFKLIDFSKPSGPPTREVEFFRPTVEMNLWLKDLEEEFLPTRSLPPTDTNYAVFLLPTGQWTHDLIRSRSDMHIFKLAHPGAGVKVRLKWRVLGATKLLPQLVLANTEGAILKKYRLRRRKEFSVPLKFGTHAFYLLKISDELGELAGQDGGFQFFNYEVGVFVEPEGG